MHLVEVGDEPHRLTNAARSSRIDPAADLRALKGKIDQCLHSHRLGDVQQGVERLDTGFEMRVGLGEMFGTDAQQQLLAARHVLIARNARRWQREGEPIKPATKRVAGLW